MKAKRSGLKFWSNRFKLNNKGIKAAIIWETASVKKKWHKQRICVSFNKKIFYAEMWGISEALKVIEQKTQEIQERQNLNIFCNSRTIINNLRTCDSKVY